MLVDTHAHLNFPDYDKDLDQVIKRSLATEVEKIICASSSVNTSRGAIIIAKQYPGIVFAAVGIHPQKTDPENQTSLINQINEIKKLASENKVIAIGECGLDYSPAPPPEKDRTKEEQNFLFEEQVKIAQKLNLPILIHSRKAFNDTFELIQRYPKLKGIFHCYSGGKKGIKKIMALKNFFFGVDGNLTYDEGLQNVFKIIPLEKTILETDCPFLAPTPFRNQRNEPANIKIIAEVLASIKKISSGTITRITTQNAQNLFFKWYNYFDD